MLAKTALYAKLSKDDSILRLLLYQFMFCSHIKKSLANSKALFDSTFSFSKRLRQVEVSLCKPLPQVQSSNALGTPLDLITSQNCHDY